MRTLPAASWLAGIVIVSAVVRAATAQHLPAPWIMVDELINSELAKSFAAHGHFAVRGVSANGYGIVYPLLIAPAWRLFDSVPRAYAAAKVIDATLMSLVAVPAYALARRLVAPRPALAAAGLAVLVPSMLYTGTLMTENAFYPVFVLATLALVAALEQPALWRQLAVVAACALAYATRAQGVALFVAVAAAPPLLGLLEREVGRRVRAFAPLYAVLAAGAAFAVGIETGRGRSPLALLGAYRAATSSQYHVSAVVRYAVWHAAELDLYLGVAPLAALLALWLAAPRLPAAGRAFAAATLPLVAALVLEVAAFASQPSVARIEERSAFYVAPIALTALLYLVARGLPRSPLVAAATIAALLPATIPFGRFLKPSAVADTLALLPWWWVHDHGVAAGGLRWLALAGAAVVAASLLLLSSRWLAVAPFAIAVYFALTTVVAENGRHGMHNASVAALHAGIGAGRKDWVDHAGEAHASVAVLWQVTPETHPLWENEIFNRSVGRVYSVDGPDPYDGNLPETPVHVATSGRVTDAATGTPVSPRLALSSLDLAGTLLARDPVTGVRLYRVRGELTVLESIAGIYPGDTWAGPRVSYRRRRCSGGTLAVELQTDASLFDRRQVIAASEQGTVVGRIVLPPGVRRTFTVPLRTLASGDCAVTFTAATTRVPADVDPGQSDRRRLAAHYLRFSYSAP
jgi:hypothetical protein